MVDKIKGGLADNMTLEQIAEKHGVTLSVIESALADGIKVEREHTDSKEQAEEIAKDHLFEDAEYYTKLAKMEKQNSKDWAKTYKASNFIEKGVCTYNDETIYLSQECLNKAITSIKGRPVVIKHQKVTPDNMQDHAVGYVSGCGFSPETAAFYCDFIVFDDEGKEVIAKDYSVSCAYIPKAFGKGGTWHNTPYDREVTELEFTHLALVPDPRYEDAKIYENAMDDDDVSDEDRWITIGAEEGKKGKKILIKAGQTAEEAIKDKFSEWAAKSKDQQKLFDTKEYKPEKDYYVFSKLSKQNKEALEVYKMTGIPPYGKLDKELEKAISIIDKKNEEFDKIKEKYKKGQITFEEFKKIKKQHDDYMEADIEGNKETSEKEETKTTGKVQRDSKKFDNYVKQIQTKLKSLKTKEDRKAYIDYIQREVEEWSEDVNYADAVEFVLKSEKQNSTDNTTKENYNMEKVEVEQGFLASLIELAQKPFMNSKKEDKEEEKIEKDDDELEYEGKKYSKKELVNAFESACAGKKAKEEEEKKNALEAEAAAKLAEEEKENSKDANDDIEFFNSMQKLMATAQSDASDKVEIPSQNKGLELGSKAFG